MGGGLNDIGEVRGNVFAYSTSADVAAFLLIDGSAAAATMRGVVHDNRFGSPDAPGAATNVTDAVKVTGPAGYLSFQRNVVLAPGSGANKVTITTAFNFAGTETANLDFQNNPILADGTGVITNHVAGLTAPFSTNGNAVDSSTMRFRRPALYGSKTFDWADLATATQQSTTVTVTGAAAGMAAIAYMDVALSGTRLWAEVTAADTVTVYQRNDTGGNVNVTAERYTPKVETQAAASDDHHRSEAAHGPAVSQLAADWRCSRRGRVRSSSGGIRQMRFRDAQRWRNEPNRPSGSPVATGNG